jgi:hypothetical protein
MASFWGRLENERVYPRGFATRTETPAALHEDIEMFYTR